MSQTRIVEVFPRDGVQSLRADGARIPSTEEKLEIIRLCVAAGLPEIEIAGFGHPRATPDLADAEVVVERLGPAPEGVVYRALAPNVKGAERALACGVTKLVVPLIASETYQRKNVNMTVAEHLRETGRVIELAAQHGASVGVGVGMLFVCPYEGWMPRAHVLAVIGEVVALGAHEINLADTFGLARPSDVRGLAEQVQERWPQVRFGLHLHDGWDGALACCMGAYEAGLRTFEAALCGVGGGIAMPATGRPGGNVATEGLLYLLESLGAQTGVDRARLREAVHATERAIGGFRHSRLYDGEVRVQLVDEAPSPSVAMSGW